MIFRTKKKDYYGETALDIVRGMESDAKDYPHRGQSIRHFLRWSLDRFSDRLPHRELDLSSRLEDETLALSYLHLCDEYGAGKIVRMPLKLNRLISTLEK